MNAVCVGALVCLLFCAATTAKAESTRAGVFRHVNVAHRPWHKVPYHTVPYTIILVDTKMMKLDTNDIAEGREGIINILRTYKVSVLPCIVMKIFGHNIIMPKSAFNAICGIICWFRHLMLFHEGINKISMENHRNMPILAYNASNGSKCRNPLYIPRFSKQDLQFIERHRIPNKALSNVIKIPKQICRTSSNSLCVCKTVSNFKHTFPSKKCGHPTISSCLVPSCKVCHNPTQ